MVRAKGEFYSGSKSGETPRFAVMEVIYPGRGGISCPDMLVLPLFVVIDIAAQPAIYYRLGVSCHSAGALTAYWSLKLSTVVVQEWKIDERQIGSIHFDTQ
jgi:hypothetical protein